MYCKIIFFFIIDATLALDNPSRFRKNLLERIDKLILRSRIKSNKSNLRAWKTMAESNEILKNDFNIDRDSIPLEEWKNIFNELVEEKSYEYQNLKQKINPSNLIYKYKTKGKSLKDFSDYQKPIDLFINL